MRNIFLKSINNNFVQKTLLSYKRSLPRIVYYHLVSNQNNIPYYYKKNLFSEELLNDQIKWYLSKGFKFIGLEEAVYLVENNENATKTIAFTTDDGFKENYETMAPIFSKFDIKSTMFLISNCLDNKDLTWDCKICLIKDHISIQKESEICNELAIKYNLKSGIKDINQSRQNWPMTKKDSIVNDAWALSGLMPLAEYLEEMKPYMTIDQVKILLNEGYTLGSHSVSHPDFSKLTEEEVLNEMIKSKETIKNVFGIEPNYFAYPYGKRPSNIVEQKVFKTGIYKLLFGTKSNLTNTKNKILWERDKMEQDKGIGQFWFTAIPILRNAILHPLGKYR